LKLIYPLFPLFFVFLVCALAETNRVPFDLPEAEAELVAGYNLEYSSITFAMFFLAEYSSMMVMAFLLLFFFFGGWISFFSTFLFYFGGLLFFLIFYVWIRATLPRYRYDQLMDIGWKVLIPFSLCFLFFLVCFLFYFDSFVLVLPEPFLNLIIF
jgi:NADH:ubiquinone oxidoreductase subunit H